MLTRSPESRMNAFQSVEEYKKIKGKNGYASPYHKDVAQAQKNGGSSIWGQHLSEFVHVSSPNDSGCLCLGIGLNHTACNPSTIASRR